MIQDSQNPNSDCYDQVLQFVFFEERIKQQNKYKGSDQMIWYFRQNQHCDEKGSLRWEI